MNTDNDIECIVCQDNINSPFIKYQHTCGIYDIHQKCLDEWFLKNSHNCIICRNNILSPTNSEISSSRESPTNSEFSSSRESPSVSSSESNYDADIESNTDVIVYSNLNETPYNVMENNNMINNYDSNNRHYDTIYTFALFFAFIVILIILFMIF